MWSSGSSPCHPSRKCSKQIQLWSPGSQSFLFTAWIHAFLFLLFFGKRKKLITFALAFPSYWLLHLNTQHVFTIITVYVVTWLPTRKRLCACADNCPAIKLSAIIVKGFIDKRWEFLSWREVLIWLFINGWRVRCFIIIALSKHGRVLCDQLKIYTSFLE